MDRDRLTKLADKFGTDKGSRFHRYTPFYSLLFTELDFKPATVLELGALDGASLAMWARYWPEARVIGVDHLPENARGLAEANGAHVWDGDLSSPGTLRGLAKSGPWDLIIDDASHKIVDQENAFYYLWESLAPGGLYILEDADTAWREEYGGWPKGGLPANSSAQATWVMSFRCNDPTWAYRTPKGTLALVWRKSE